MARIVKKLTAHNSVPAVVMMAVAHRHSKEIVPVHHGQRVSIVKTLSARVVAVWAMVLAKMTCPKMIVKTLLVRGIKAKLATTSIARNRVPAAFLAELAKMAFLKPIATVLHGPRA